MVSIIIPIYNVEKYLKRCIESVISQTYKDIEIILVDDGSPDRCGDICDQYASIDKRIVVIHKENGGLSDARNHGILKAKGEYLAFIDSDDYVSEDFIEVLYSICKKYNCDIAQCEFEKTYDDDILLVQEENDEVIVKRGTEHIEDLIVNKSISDMVVWNKLYKRYLFDQLLFPVGKINEDNFINYKLYYKASCIGISNLKLYYYYQSPNSIMRSGFSLNRLDYIEALENRITFLLDKQFDYKFIQEARIEIVHALVHFYYNVYYYLSKKEPKLKELKAKFNNECSVIFLNKNINSKTKLSLLLFYFAPSIYMRYKKGVYEV